MMKIRYGAIVGIYCSFLFGCSQKLYFGEYCQNIPNVSSEAFIINSDSTFNYHFRFGEWNSIHAYGKWSLVDKKIILNSTYNPAALPLTVMAMTDENINGYSFAVKPFYSPRESPTLWQILIINDSLRVRITDSVIKLNYPSVIRSIRIELREAQLLDNTDTATMRKVVTKDFYTKGNKSNTFIISYPFPSYIFHYEYFNNEELQVEHKALVWALKNKKYKLL